MRLKHKTIPPLMTMMTMFLFILKLKKKHVLFS